MDFYESIGQINKKALFRPPSHIALQVSKTGIRFCRYSFVFLIFLGSFFVFGAGKASITTYYVDSSIADTYVASSTPDFTTYNPITFSTTTGSASVFKTIADINAFSTLQPDDQVLFRKGQIWREQLNVPASGTSGHPITFGAYGSGANPIISGSNLASSGWTQAASNKLVYLTSGTSTSVPSDWNSSINSIETIGGGGAGHDGNSSANKGAGAPPAGGAAAGGAAAGGAPAGRRSPRPKLGLGARIAAVALLTGLAGAVQPGFLPLVALVGVGFALSTVLAGPRTAGLRAAGVALAGTAGAFALLLPWDLGWLPPNGEWATFTGVNPGGPPLRLAALLRFQTGPLGAAPLGYALLVAAVLPLLIGRDWRAAWAVRFSVLALVAFGLAWAGQHAALGIVWPPVDMLLVPAAVAIALLVALGIAAFDLDLSGFAFGWRQAASGVAAAATLLACIPVLGAMADGRWHQRRIGFDSVLSWMPEKRADGDFRVLWLGSSGVLPIAGWPVAPGVSYATSRNGPPVLTDRWPATSAGPTRLLAQAVTLATNNQTTDLGHLLAPMGVRYLVVVERPAPLESKATLSRPIPPSLRNGLESQLDLRRIDRSGAMTIYENDAWAPIRSQISDRAAAAAATDDPRVARSVDLHGALPVLPSTQGPTSAAGNLPGGADIAVAEAPSGHWHLSVGGRAAAGRPGFGSSTLYATTVGGHGALGYETPLGWRVGLLVEALLWIGALAVVVLGRRRPRQTTGAPVSVTVMPERVAEPLIEVGAPS